MPEFDNRPDRLTVTLDGLRSDLERTPLADSLSVRRRGDQRTRRQAVGGAVAVVALVAGLAGVYGGIGGSNGASQVPATGGPTASTSVEQPLELAADPLLQPSAIGDIGAYTGWKLSPDQASVNDKVHGCVPSPGTLGASQTGYGYYYTDLDATAVEHVLRFDTAAAAKGAESVLFDALSGCARGAATDNVVDTGPAPVAVADVDSAQVAMRDAAPPDSEVTHYELGVVRKGNILVVLQWNSMGLPEGVTQVWDSQRLTAAIDRAVAH